MSDVIDFNERRDKKRVENGEAGFFINCPDDPAEILEPLGDGDAPEAIGIMWAFGEPKACGWALLPHEAKAFAEALLKLIDKCK